MADKASGISDDPEYFVKFGDDVRNFSTVTLTLNLVNTGMPRLFLVDHAEHNRTRLNRINILPHLERPKKNCEFKGWRGFASRIDFAPG